MSAQVDIALATYNGSKFLDDLLASIRDQSYTNIRVWASDDGSLDGTVELLKQAASAMNLKIAPHKPAGNILRNFENAIAASEAPYVALCDQDDVWHSQKVELLLARIRALERDHGREMPLLVFCDLEIVGPDLSTIHTSFFESSSKSASARTFRDFALNNHAPGCAVMVNRALIDLATPFPAVEIHDHWLIQLAALCGRVDCVDVPLVKYRQHGNNSIGLGVDTQDSAMLSRLFARISAVSSRRKLWQRRVASIRSNMAALSERVSDKTVSNENRYILRSLVKPDSFLKLSKLFRGALTGERTVDKLGILWTLSRSR